MVDWPVALPQLQLTGLTERRGDTRLRSEVDTGPAIVRRRYTAAVRAITVPVVFDAAEKLAFDAFYAGDLQEGALSFNWTDPVSGATTAMRFAGTAGPQFTQTGSHWYGRLELEILP